MARRRGHPTRETRAGNAAKRRRRRHVAGPRPWAEASAGLSGRKPCHEPRLHGFIEACVLNETSARSSPMASARVRWGSKAGSGSSTSTPSSPGASRRRTASSRRMTCATTGSKSDSGVGRSWLYSVWVAVRTTRARRSYSRCSRVPSSLSASSSSCCCTVLCSVRLSSHGGTSAPARCNVKRASAPCFAYWMSAMSRPCKIFMHTC
mmetsp:Transcript_10399/g.33550  ORF Transcript_10399/g.33550 Transcript_10399/m.33550 type:complete len:207 (+) Transcript_10399:399-1019(+)